MRNNDLLPNLLIAGVTKAGTTSLFWYLAQHPDICAGSKKEIDYFSPLRYGRQPEAAPSDYAGYFAHCSGQHYRLDASPLYFYGGSALVDAVKQTLPQARILIALRDPTDRLWSAYRYKKLQEAIDQSMTFRSFFEHSLRLRESGADEAEHNDVYRALSIGCYIDSLQFWLDAFDDQVRIVFFEDLARAPAATVGSVCQWLDVDPTPVEGFDYGASKRTIKPRSQLLHRGARALNEAGDRLFRLNSHRRVKTALRDAYHRVNARRRVEPFLPDDQAMTRAFYAQPNELLAKELLGRGYRELPPWLSSAAQGAAWH